MKLNAIQEKAVTTIDRNLCLIAGAGTGKTTVLTARVLHIYQYGKIPKGREIPSVLAITFTEKAASEMKQRIGRALKGKDSPLFKRLYREFPHAPIYTIHGFCHKVLQEFPDEVGIPEDFEVIDETVSGQLEEEAIKETIEKFRRDPEALTFFAKRLGLSEERKIGQKLLELVEEARNANVRLKIPKISDGEVGVKEYEDLLGAFSLLADEAKKSTKVAKLRNSPEFSAFWKVTTIERQLEVIRNIEESLRNTGKGTSQRDKLEEGIELFKRNSEKLNVPSYRLILRILLDFTNRYEAKKKDAGVLDFYDLVAKTGELLEKEEVLKILQKRFPYIMVDEFQDTDPLQSEIIEKLGTVESPFDGPNIFVVGDPKQSIYGFRGSDVSSFLRVTERMKRYGAEILYLEENYRSVPEVIDFVNRVFEKQMNPYRELQAKRSKNGVPPILLTSEGGEEEAVGDYLLELFHQGVSPEEVAILFRSSEPMKGFEEALSNRGIPHLNLSSRSFFKTPEISDTLLLLKALAFPEDDLIQAAALRTPALGFSDGFLGSLFGNGVKDPHEWKKYERWQGTADFLRKKETTLEVGAFLEEIFEVFHLRALYAPGDFSYRRRGNLEKLLDMALDFQEKGSFREFVREVMLLSEGKESEVPPRTESVGVRLLTVHGSKGLEFPVVILPKIGRAFSGNYQEFNFNEKGELGLKRGYSSYQYEKNTLENRKKDLEEEIRVTYVAMTRARDRLVFSCDKPEKARIGSIASFLAPYWEEIEKWTPSPAPYVSKDRRGNFLGTPLYSLPFQKKGLVKNRYSISQFLTYRKSPAEYYLKHCLGMDPSGYGAGREGINPGVFGSIYHKYMEMTLRGGADLREIADSFGVKLSSREREELFAMGNRTLETMKGQKIRTEKEFFYPFEGKIFHGFIDQLRQKGGRTEVWDLKTNRVFSDLEELKNDYEPQIILYMLAVHEVLEEDCSGGVLYFARTGDQVFIPRDPGKEEELKKNLRKFIEDVEAPDFEERILESQEFEERWNRLNF